MKETFGILFDKKILSGQLSVTAANNGNNLQKLRTNFCVIDGLNNCLTFEDTNRNIILEKNFQKFETETDKINIEEDQIYVSRSNNNISCKFKVNSGNICTILSPPDVKNLDSLSI